MQIKSILTFSVLSATVLVSPANYARDKNHNFLVGGEIGYQRQKEEFSTDFIAPGLALPVLEATNQSHTISDKATLLGLIAGWQWQCQRALLGVEANVDFANFRKNPFFAFAVNDPSSVTTANYFNAAVLYERGNVYALTGRAGYFVTPGFMPYVRLGAQVSRDEVSYQVSGTTLPGSNPTISDYTDKKQDVYGVVAGIGVEFPAFIGPSTLRFEYTFNKTESISIEDDALPVSGTHRFHRPETNAFKVAWVWNFL